MRKIDINLNELASVCGDNIQSNLNSLSSGLNSSGFKEFMSSLGSSLGLAGNCNYAVQCMEAAAAILIKSRDYIENAYNTYSGVEADCTCVAAGWIFPLIVGPAILENRIARAIRTVQCACTPNELARAFTKALEAIKDWEAAGGDPVVIRNLIKKVTKILEKADWSVDVRMRSADLAEAYREAMKVLKDWEAAGGDPVVIRNLIKEVTKILEKAGWSPERIRKITDATPLTFTNAEVKAFEAVKAVQNARTPAEATEAFEKALKALKDWESAGGDPDLIRDFAKDINTTLRRHAHTAKKAGLSGDDIDELNRTIDRAARFSKVRFNKAKEAKLLGKVPELPKVGAVEVVGKVAGRIGAAGKVFGVTGGIFGILEIYSMINELEAYQAEQRRNLEAGICPDGYSICVDADGNSHYVSNEDII